MTSASTVASFEEWLADVRNYINAQTPELLPLFDVYSVEARFGRRYINESLLRLPGRARVLEIGAGSLLLSCQLIREGFEVTALEPIGSGFSHFGKLRELVLEKARQKACYPAVLDLPAEALAVTGYFDFAFSVNVMEHVADVAISIAKVSASLKPGATYRFTCPNYLFPYEPHFNSPTLFSKRLTEKLFGDKLFNNKQLADPYGTWKSLNWINVCQIRREVKRLPGLRVVFNRNLLVSTLERITTDNEFASRRANWMRIAILALVRLRLHRLAGLIPALFQPIVDCLIIRTIPTELE